VAPTRGRERGPTPRFPRPPPAAPPPPHLCRGRGRPGRHHRPGRRRRDSHPPGRHRPARLRLLLGRDRRKARRHPPGRPAALGGCPAMTTSGAAAAIAPEPHGSGPVAPADDAITLADLRSWERQLAGSGGCSRPVRITGRITATDRATGQTAEVFKTWTDVPYLDGKGEPATYRDDHPLHVP